MTGNDFFFKTTKYKNGLIGGEKMTLRRYLNDLPDDQWVALKFKRAGFYETVEELKCVPEDFLDYSVKETIRCDNLEGKVFIVIELYEPYGFQKKISEEDYNMAKILKRNGFVYVARDEEDDYISAFRKNPELHYDDKDMRYWVGYSRDESTGAGFEIPKDCFEFVTPENSPFKISKIITQYEEQKK